MPVCGIYVHIPFCQKKCNYCDFYSLPLGRVPGFVLDEFPVALAREAALRAAQGSLAGQEIISVYFGGGTPTCLPEKALVSVLKSIRSVLPVPLEAEITVEANPGTVDEGYLLALRLAGFNRLSLGAQAWQSGLLRRMGRVHGPREVTSAMVQAKLAGFDNIGVDLMYGLPGQTLADWRETLRELLDLEPQHVSVYGLVLEEGTPWGDLAATGRLRVPDEHQELEMLELAARFLEETGLERYEIANYASPGWRSRHNQLYWQCRDYLGLGPGATSRLGEARYTNSTSLDGYLPALRQWRLPPVEAEHLERKLLLEEAVFMGLRLLEGIDLAAFADRYGVRAEVVFSDAIATLVSRKLLEIASGKLRLTRSALPVANEVFMEFIGGRPC